jgi:23S rRNA (uracil1939-C5)-methyltransferase
MIQAGSVVTVDVEKPTAGGRMLARHRGQVVLVWGAIPGERVAARIERTGKGVAYADTIEVLSSSSDRRSAAGDWRCGGNVLAHVDYARQLELKGEIIRDAFGRIGRIRLDRAPIVVGSPERGYRMRARFHVQNGRIGFYREGTHHLCDAAKTGQLLDETNAWIAATEDALRHASLNGVGAIEIAENVAGDERAGHLDLLAGVDPSPYGVLSNGFVGLSAHVADQHTPVVLSGSPVVTDIVSVRDDDSSTRLRLQRSARAFFQGNRYLLDRLVRHVIEQVSAGPVVDLYAGGGLFGLALAATGVEDVTLVEADPISGADLQRNADPFRPRIHVHRASVESFLASRRHQRPATVVVDPPRTGLSKDAARGLLAMTPTSVVYVSCDVATLARDSRVLLDRGYQLGDITGLDLFPNTAHVETVTVFRLSV